MALSNFWSLKLLKKKWRECSILGVWVGHIESPAQEVHRVPFKLVMRQLSKHAQLSCLGSISGFFLHNITKNHNNAAGGEQGNNIKVCLAMHTILYSKGEISLQGPFWWSPWLRSWVPAALLPFQNLQNLVQAIKNAPSYSWWPNSQLKACTSL